MVALDGQSLACSVGKAGLGPGDTGWEGRLGPWLVPDPQICSRTQGPASGMREPPVLRQRLTQGLILRGVKFLGWAGLLTHSGVQNLSLKVPALQAWGLQDALL